MLRISGILTQINVPVKPLIDQPDPALLHGKDFAFAFATDAINLTRYSGGCRSQLEQQKR